MNRKAYEQFQYENPTLTINEIQKEDEKNQDKLIKSGMDSDVVKTMAWAITKRNLLKQVGVISQEQYGGSGEVVELEGVLIGVGEYRDRAEEMRTKAKKTVEREGKAVAMGGDLVDIEGNTLDTREKLYGKPNDGHKKPLDPELKLLEMTLYGAYREKGTDTPFTFTRFQTSNNALAEAWNKVDVNENLFIPYDTWGKIRVDEYGFLIYGLTGSSKTTFKKSDAGFDIPSAIEQALGQYMTVIGDAYETYKTWLPKITGTQNPDMTKRFVDWNACMAVKGVITDIQKERDFWKGVPAKMWDLDDVASTIDIYLPVAYKSSNIGEYTTGIAFGKPDEVWVKGDDGKYNTRSGKAEIKVYGFFPIHLVASEDSPDMSGETMEQYVGFEN